MSQPPGAPAYGHDGLFLDLDGVVYVGRRAVPHAPEAIADARRSGMRVAFLTNNASRTPAEVADHLTALGVPAAPEDVVTAAQAAAGLLVAGHGTGAHVLVLGGPGLHEAVAAAGLVATTDPDAAVDAVATGFGPDVRWSAVMEVATVLTRGVPWVASNADAALPTERGPAPGHGALVRLLADFSGRAPVVAGKPGPALLEEAVRRTGVTRPLVVGDRLDTDIAGARAAGVPSALVLTGVCTRDQAADAPEHQRPTYVVDDLRALITG